MVLLPSAASAIPLQQRRVVEDTLAIRFCMDSIFVDMDYADNRASWMRFEQNFNQNFYNAKKNNILRGAYHFYSPQSSAAEQAKFFCKIVQLDESDLPPVLDVEKIGDLSPAQLCKELKIWLRIVEEHYHIKPVLYASFKFRQKYLQTLEFDKNPYWIAHYYVDTLAYKGPWHFWQHTDAGKIDGVKGYVDINVFNGTYEDLINMTIQRED